MKPVKRQTDEELKYNASDARTAIAALPAGYNAERYLAELRACTDEQEHRARMRIWRRMLRRLFDPMMTGKVIAKAPLYCLGPLTYRPRPVPSNYVRAEWRSAAFRLAWMRLYGV